jgi:hypothetical protein
LVPPSRARSGQGSSHIILQTCNNYHGTGVQEDQGKTGACVRVYARMCVRMCAREGYQLRVGPGCGQALL